MERSKHTPGPWTAERHLVGAGAERVAVAVASPSSDHYLANARLIAAAPDMLEALRYLVETAPCRNGCAPDDMTCATMKARAAIARAEGQP